MSAPQFADYPAVIPYSKSRSLFLDSGRGELSPEERTVRGTFVQGLNDRDVALLDLFEGNVSARRLHLRGAIDGRPRLRAPGAVPPPTAPTHAPALPHSHF